MVSCEPAWNEDEAGLAEALVYYEDNLCGRGHYLPESTRNDLARKVEKIARSDTPCEDCKAEDRIRADHHRQYHRAKGSKCDCDAILFYVSERVPIPETTQNGQKPPSDGRKQAPAPTPRLVSSDPVPADPAPQPRRFGAPTQ